MKLSRAQIDLLRTICAKPCYIAEYYSPARVLIREKLAEWKGRELHPTEEGRKQHAIVTVALP